MRAPPPSKTIGALLPLEVSTGSLEQRRDHRRETQQTEFHADLLSI